MSDNEIYKEVYNFDRLKRAAKNLQIRETEETEILLFNLHNNLIWRSYEPGKDPITDAIFLSAFTEALEDYYLNSREGGKNGFTTHESGTRGISQNGKC